MKIKRMVFILILLLFIGGCNIIKTLLLLKSGKIENKFFTEIIHYENRATLIIVHPEIKGKQYNFILDTGATTVISEEIVNDLNLEIKSIVNSGDSQNNTSKTAFTLLPKLKIGNLCFKNIGTAIIDFNKITEIQCLDIDGIIGANIMKLAKWQIDYQNHTLTVSDDFNNLDMSGDEIVLHFTTNVSGTPLVELNLPANKTVKDVFIDTGMDRSITLSQKYYKKLLDNFPDMKVVKGFGSTSASAFGYSQDSVYYAKLPQIKLDELEISNIVIEFKGENHNLIGNEILNNYTVSFDWETKQMFLEQVKCADYNSLESFGFKPIIQDHKLIVGFVFENSPASDCGLEVGNQILSLNGIDFSNISEEQYCELIIEKRYQKEYSEINLQWQNQDGLIKSSILRQIDLLSN